MTGGMLLRLAAAAVPVIAALYVAESLAMARGMGAMNRAWGVSARLGIAFAVFCLLAGGLLAIFGAQ